MAAWMDQKLRTGDSYLPKSSESSTSTENHSTLNGEDAGASDYDLHSEVNSEMSDAATLEQRRTYKIELQVGIFLSFCKGWPCVV
jgi:brefeldin A-inhibited guanine nucleotide-exchange protein